MTPCRALVPLSCASALALAAIGCGARTDLSDLGRLDARGAVDADPCPSGLPGPALVLVAGTSVCIDATEVKNSDYAAFLASSPSAGTGVCAFNTTHVPLFLWPPAPEHLDDPVVNVNWCDARAYCLWAHKALCGKPDGSAGDLGDVQQPSGSVWFSACSAGGATTYPYGQAYDPTACNTLDAHRDTVAPAGAFSACEGGEPKIHDMSGNAWEWEDACSVVDGGLQCAVRGGGFRNDEFNVGCSVSYPTPIATAYDYYGFRCCSVP